MTRRWDPDWDKYVSLWCQLSFTGLGAGAERKTNVLIRGLFQCHSSRWRRMRRGRLGREANSWRRWEQNGCLHCLEGVEWGFYESEQSSVRASLLMRPHSFPLEDPFASCPAIVKIHALINTSFPEKKRRDRYISYSWSGTRGYDFLRIDHIAVVIMWLFLPASPPPSKKTVFFWEEPDEYIWIHFIRDNYWTINYQKWIIINPQRVKISASTAASLGKRVDEKVSHPLFIWMTQPFFFF